jgi:hypothetical protein
MNMRATQTADFLRRLRAGQLGPTDAAYLEQLKPDDLLADLAEVYPLRFQERHLSKKWEVGMARRLRFELVARFSRGSQLPTLLLVPVLRQCLLLSGEGQAITGISTIRRIVVRPIHKPSHGLALTTSGGFKFDKLPDDWEVKPLGKRTVKLTEDFLRQRGWQFDRLRQVVPSP